MKGSPDSALYPTVLKAVAEQSVFFLEVEANEGALAPSEND